MTARRATQPRATRRNATQRFAVRAGIAHREIAGTLLLLLPNDSHLYAFNETGRMVWRGLLRKQSSSAIAAAVAKHFSIPPTRAARDVDALLADLLRRGVIRRA